MRAIFLITAVAFLGGSFTLQAQRKGGGGNRGGDPDQRNAVRDFGSVKAEFDAWKLSVLNAGISTIPAGEDGGTPQDFYEFLRLGAQEERLPDSDFVELGQDYIRLVLKAQKQGQAAVEEDLSALQKRAIELSNGTLDAATATLDVNKKQVEAQELYWFGILSDKLSTGKRSTIDRKQKALAQAENQAKADKTMESREREKLKEDADEIVQYLMVAIGS